MIPSGLSAVFTMPGNVSLSESSDRLEDVGPALQEEAERRERERERREDREEGEVADARSEEVAVGVPVALPGSVRACGHGTVDEVL